LRRRLGRHRDRGVDRRRAQRREVVEPRKPDERADVEADGDHRRELGADRMTGERQPRDVHAVAGRGRHGDLGTAANGRDDRIEIDLGRERIAHDGDRHPARASGGATNEKSARVMRRQ